ncbi:prolipoprotein diacylglyceryl transferase [Dokdonia donghaensis]|uniref:Phosphatidylglycerol--prolipoprotein diacylglyceryl transferase n=1 Tax=Dokdonia donghaensis DSW-1 TaxID=1300343 RepID=A0A0A2GSM8_9FLAO|nr:prolipoprotein diacylglyceryl transferase [Dokdonia donghaensis]ANH61608.1 Prolipoprotein diacylglyceryl transferase [Dokdonia donghaensis DSW-1]KGO06207.1 diacylglyceryl transferase [Dokdonia donghaensis DSW-1]
MFALKFTWNPVSGLDLGFITIHFYSLMFVVAFSLGFYLMKKMFIREEVAIEKLDSLFIYAVVSTLLGARLGHVFFYQTELLWEDPLSVILPFRFVPEFEFTGFRGLASHGAAIATIFGLYLYNKKILHKSVLWILDRVVITCASGAIFVRIGNFLNSEMVGKITDGPLGIQFVQDEISERRAVGLTNIQNPKKAYQALTEDPQFSEIISSIPYRYPGQLMEAFGYVFVFIILYLLYWKTEARKKPGFLFGLFLLLLMTVRLVVENFKREQVEGREDWIFNLNTGQVLSIPFILIGLYFVITAFTKKPINETN